jgi:hypothetical protein
MAPTDTADHYFQRNSPKQQRHLSQGHLMVHNKLNLGVRPPSESISGTSRNYSPPR